MSKLTERQSQEPLPLVRSDAEHFQRHPIPGQQVLFATATARENCPLGDACRRSTEYCPACERYGS